MLEKEQPSSPSSPYAINPGDYGTSDTWPLYLGNFLLQAGGIGDYICWFSALKWAYDTQPWLAGRTFSVAYLTPLLEHFFPNWTHLTHDQYERQYATVSHYSSLQPVYNTGHHMIDYGFTIFTNLGKPDPAYNHYVDIPPIAVPPELALPEKYVVLTPCGTTVKTRTQSSSSFNGFKDYLLAKGHNVVLVGSTGFGTGEKRRETPVLPEYDLTGCTSLIDKTDLLTAHAVMAGAEAVCGVDSGLLHVALTTHTPVLFGYTIAGPIHREPRRKPGLVYENLFPEVACQFCQSRIRYVDHDFKNCIEKHYRCIAALSAERFAEGFERLMAKAALEPGTHLPGEETAP